jgi:hypothetical protein
MKAGYFISGFFGIGKNLPYIRGVEICKKDLTKLLRITAFSKP